jgi:dihydroneopterin aldolase
VSVELYAHVERGRVGAGGRPFIDYDHVRGSLKSWPSRPHTPLLETLAEEVIGLCFENPVVEACRVSIVKPDIFNDAAAAGVEIYRLRPHGAR